MTAMTKGGETKAFGAFQLNATKLLYWRACGKVREGGRELGEEKRCVNCFSHLWHWKTRSLHSPGYRKTTSQMGTGKERLIEGGRSSEVGEKG